MSIVSVASRIGFSLDSHTLGYIQSELVMRLSGLHETGNGHLSEDEVIKEVIEVLFDFRHSSASGREAQIAQEW
jgi:hypothetical protein